jgi:hypothetical protein
MMNAVRAGGDGKIAIEVNTMNAPAISRRNPAGFILIFKVLHDAAPDQIIKRPQYAGL